MQAGLFDQLEQDERASRIEPHNLFRWCKGFGFQNVPKDYMDLAALFPEHVLANDLDTHAAAAAVYRYATGRGPEFRWQRDDLPETFSEEGARLIGSWWQRCRDSHGEDWRKVHDELNQRRWSR